MGSLLPENNRQAAFGQIYFCDEDAQEIIRNNIFPQQLSNWLIRQIQNTLCDINPYILQYIAAANLIRESPDIDLRLILHQGNNYNSEIINNNNNLINHHPRRYNKPSANEVAAIVIGTDEERLKLTREIAVYKINQNGLQIISDDHPSYDPMHYVLMFPHGENGWAPNMYRKYAFDENLVDNHHNNQQNIIQINNNNNNLVDQNLILNPNEFIHNHFPNNLNETNESDIDDDNNESNISLDSINSLNSEDNDDEYGNDAVASSHNSLYVSCCEYYSYKLMRRDDSVLHLFRNLYQQYVVDNYLKIEHQKLKWFMFNQAKLRVELYKGLVDAVNTADANLNETGRRLILPSSFVGGPRYMLNLFHDSMAIVRQYGKPDLFITVTCNPKWFEITSRLLLGQRAQDQPDLVTRVFRLKLNAIMDQLIKCKVLGEVVAHMHVIEFQKRVKKFNL